MMTNKTPSWARLAALLLALLPAGFLAAGCASTSTGDRDVDTSRTEETPPAPMTDEEREIHLASFDHVWKTIRDKHYDPDLGGIDWDAVKTDLRPRVETAESAGEARSAMQEMIGKLGLSHFGIIPGDVYAAEEEEEKKEAKTSEKKAMSEASTAAGGEASDSGATSTGATEAEAVAGESGLVIRIIDGHAYVTQIWDGFPVVDLGVRPGWEVRKVGSMDVRRTLERLEKSKSPGISFLARGIEQRLHRDVGDTVTVLFGNENDEEVELDVPMGPRRGTKARLGNLPSMFFWFDEQSIDDDIGYFGFSAFLDPMRLMPSVQKSVTAFMERDGMIIDLRGNPGGIGGLAMGIAGWFIDKKAQKLGVMVTRNTDIKFVVNPRARTYSGPVAILIDEHTASTSEIFSGGMQDLGRARVFGKTSAGAALPSVIEKLPNGDGFQYAVANYVSEGGVTLEGNGVTPDEKVVPTREQLLDDQDPALQAAIDWIRSQKGS